MRTALIALVSLGLITASLLIDQRAHSGSEARHLGFGYPLHFASANFGAFYSTSSRYPQTFRLDPWEIPVEANPLTFILSWLIVYAVLLGCWLAARNSFRRLVTE